MEGRRDGKNEKTKASGDKDQNQFDFRPHTQTNHNPSVSKLNTELQELRNTEGTEKGTKRQWSTGRRGEKEGKGREDKRRGDTSLLIPHPNTFPALFCH